MVRNTPTGVGKTYDCARLPGPYRKHPHGRGEDEATGMLEARMEETPPRAWGRLYGVPDYVPDKRNTPTGVGKTLTYSSIIPPPLETPPRAWGRRLMDRERASTVRNTPTGVGKTTARRTKCRWSGKHPHGRGEDSIITNEAGEGLETPPRAWGRLKIREFFMPELRNTPTGVGKTLTELAAEAVY